MRTLARRLLLGTAIVSVGVLGTATAAQAAPANCTLTVGVPTDGAKVRCTSGTGEYRVVLECIALKPGDPVIARRPGPWVAIQGTSSNTCSGPPSLYEAWYEVR